MLMNAQISFQLDSGAMIKISPSLLVRSETGTTIQFGDSHSHATITLNNPTSAEAAATYPHQRKGSITRSYREVLVGHVGELPLVQSKRPHFDTDTKGGNKSRPSVFTRLSNSKKLRTGLQGAPTTFARGTTETEGFATVRLGIRAGRTSNRILRKLEDHNTIHVVVATKNNFDTLADNTEEIATKMMKKRHASSRPLFKITPTTSQILTQRISNVVQSITGQGPISGRQLLSRITAVSKDVIRQHSTLVTHVDDIVYCQGERPEHQACRTTMRQTPDTNKDRDRVRHTVTPPRREIIDSHRHKKRVDICKPILRLGSRFDYRKRPEAGGRSQVPYMSRCSC